MLSRFSAGAAAGLFLCLASAVCCLVFGVLLLCGRLPSLADREAAASKREVSAREKRILTVVTGIWLCVAGVLLGAAMLSLLAGNMFVADVAAKVFPFLWPPYILYILIRFRLKRR